MNGCRKRQESGSKTPFGRHRPKSLKRQSKTNGIRTKAVGFSRMPFLWQPDAKACPGILFFSKSTARTAAACADDFLRDCEWPEETESFACEPFHRAAAALTTMPRWRAESAGDALLFWRAVARAGAAVAESAQWRLQGVATGNFDR